MGWKGLILSFSREEINPEREETFSGSHSQSASKRRSESRQGSLHPPQCIWELEAIQDCPLVEWLENCRRPCPETLGSFTPHYDGFHDPVPPWEFLLPYQCPCRILRTLLMKSHQGSCIHKVVFPLTASLKSLTQETPR